MPHGEDRVFMRALRLALLASRGGGMRGRILVTLAKQPLNPLALAKQLGVDYKTSLYHLEKLQKQNLVLKKGDGYGAVYVVTFTPDQEAIFRGMVSDMGESL
ncbi:MAG: winged helix-turn-helix domain-containing protein [Candidatus Diapherotrites archaeon]|nr:winged helix-turn-helix domain-containing protein [Candidatus Diapherotrites archaeon]